MTQSIMLEFGGPGEMPRRLPLPTESAWRIRIGSAFDCDVRLTASQAAPAHCDLWSQDGKIFLGTGRWTFAEGRAIDFPVRQRIGSRFEVGGVEFRLLSAEESTEWEGAHEATVILGERPREVAAAARIPLQGESIVLGRTVEGAGRIDDLQISRRHAEMQRRDGAWHVRDLKSTNGTFVNGERVDRWRKVVVGDRISLGSVLFEFTGRALLGESADSGVQVDVLRLSKTVRHRDTGKPLNLIDDISLSVKPGEFVAMLGSSGCGKSTFMDAINGRRRATRGEVLLGGRSLYDEFPSLKKMIGYVPQEVVFHRALPVGEALRHASRLRLPTDMSGEEIDRNIDEVLDVVGLAARKRTPIAALSGGQQKRVSIAIELLSRPAVLFLDEVTSGLDAKTEAGMMDLFRKLADEGLTVFCITHHLESLQACHHIAYFFGGKLAFFGPESGFRQHFGIEHNSEIYRLEENADPSEWAERYQRSSWARELIHGRLGARESRPAELPAEVSENAGAETTRLSAERFGLQTATLTRRFVSLLLADRLTLGVTLAMAPVTAGLIAFAAQDWSSTGGFQARTVAFMAIVSSFFLGLFTSIREIVKELPIYLHERMVSLEIAPYLLSKIVPLLVINIVQVVCVVAILRRFTDAADVGDAFQMGLMLLSVSAAGTLLGLCVSALVHKVDAAVSVMVFVIVPQLLLAGNFAPLEGPRLNAARAVVTSFWAYKAADVLAPVVTMPSAPPPPSRASRGGQAPPPPSQPQTSPSKATTSDWLPSFAVIWGQCVFLVSATFLLLLRRDGPGALGRFFSGAGRVIQAQTSSDRVPLLDLVRGAGRGLNTR